MKTPQTNFGLFSSAVLLLVLSGCGPIYDTQYSFEPPQSASGPHCIYQCDTTKAQCIELKQMRADSCNERSQRQSYYCTEDIRSRYNREPKWYECTEELCSDDTDFCDDQYRSCYQACGGRVNRETRCIANCPTQPQGN
jgi:hypothetical protein